MKEKVILVLAGGLWKETKVNVQVESANNHDLDIKAFFFFFFGQCYSHESVQDITFTHLWNEKCFFLFLPISVKCIFLGINLHNRIKKIINKKNTRKLCCETVSDYLSYLEMGLKSFFCCCFFLCLFVCFLSRMSRLCPKRFRECTHWHESIWWHHKFKDTKI